MPSGEGRLTLTNPIARSGALACAGWYHWLEGEHRAAQRAWTRARRAAEHLDRARSILEALGCRGGVEDQTLPSP